MDKYTWGILFAILCNYIFYPVLQILWERWKRARQIRQAEKWRKEADKEEMEEFKRLYREATKHADRVYVIKKVK